MDIDITADDLALLTKWDTPTICNALEEIIPERRGYGFTTTHLFSLDPALPPVCGFARTATIQAAAPSPETTEQMVAKRAAYMNMLRPHQRQPLSLFKISTRSPGLAPFGVKCKPTSIKGLVFWGLLPTGHFVMCRIAPAALI